MDILKEGTKQESGQWLGECNRCGAIIRAERQELRVEQGDYRSDHEDFAWAGCDSCNNAHCVCFHQIGTGQAATLIKKLKKIGVSI